jgi:Ca-activated chloride channel homolog
MVFQWPWILPLLGLIPLILGIYIWNLRRRKRFTVRYSSLALVRDAISRGMHIRRHLPFGLFLVGLASLVVAFSRPSAPVAVPSGQATIMLAIDVSRSMCSTDIPPNRLKAAQAAVLSFIDKKDQNTQIGIVAFAGFAAVVQPPTSDQELLRTAVRNLTTARRTAIGSGIQTSLDAISEVNEGFSLQLGGSNIENQEIPWNGTEIGPDIIVVLSDGANNSGPHPLDVAQEAVEMGVRVYTIGYGSATGAPMNCGNIVEDQFFSGSGGFSGGGGGFGGGGFRRGIDEQTLMAIAEMTGGEYYSAVSAGELHDVFRQLSSSLTTKVENTEISVAFTAAGLLLAFLAIMLSMVWHPLP